MNDPMTAWEPPPARYTVRIEKSRFGWWAHRQHGIAILTPSHFSFTHKRLLKKIAWDEKTLGPASLTAQTSPRR